MLICRVLGPLQVTAGSTTVDVGGPQPRRLVQALALARGAPVPEDRLAQAIWGDSPPAGPAASIQAYVSRLRRVLPAATLTRGPGGYALATRCDAADFEALLDQARTAARPAEAVGLYGQALALWRGRPYPDLDAYAEAGRAHLNGLRATAVEDRAAALLAVGDAPAAVTELLPAVQDEPYRERRWEQLILGLYRSARQAEALAALRRVRGLLADDLGVDPGPGLQNLERRLLAQDPSLLLSATLRPPTPRRPLTRFVGRRTEKDLLTAALAESRLVTLVGPGGAGKTRLALEWAHDAALARLADVRSPLDLPSAIATALGLAETPPRFTGISGLLVLDNCEHLTGAVADLALTLLADNPDLRVLATGREALGVDGERLLPVGPMPHPDAVTLLADRIAAVRPGWHPDPVETDEIDRLADALDGIPLALELAAARARVLSLTELTGLLGEHFPALGRVPRGALTPHATLEATVAWSVDLLPARDRAMLLRLWPFEGGFTLEAAGAVGCDLAGLSSLVARSVVTADTTDTPARYRLLEIIRAYCREHDPAPADSRAAHAAWARDLVARTVPDLRGRRSARAMRVLTRELPNLRAALAHAPAESLRTTAMLEWFWVRGGHAAEGLRLIALARHSAPHAPALDRAWALSASAGLHWIGGDLSQVRHDVQAALTVLGEPEDDEGRRLLGQLRYYEALLWIALGDPSRGAESARLSVELAAATGESWFGALPQVVLGAARVAQGDVEQGRRILRDAVGQAREHGYGWSGGFASLLLARSFLDDDPAAAFAPLREAAAWFREEDDTGQVLSTLVHGALALFRVGKPLAAATLHAAAYAEAGRRGIRLDNADPPTVTALRAEVEALDPEVRDRAVQAAVRIPVDELPQMLTRT
ncbi:winged helix-turn-helix domain-containing protein [Kineosporia sp. J2-2]|uniref:Winged helix-turn-helix domain-containing protein n=1 Tax=Kineosporia corallincola TaxID=2835133 RepID=A0ABS5TES9_9ACTN|nr:BTAD domain-containing putative transcriptional regulator [Kineosporia corallincola]MBT0768598.1 winged helix-turn-helix domain-containing protein [Kineosporia corallincola]